jgi:hypothetical protein
MKPEGKMPSKVLPLNFVLLACLAALRAPAATLYVDVNNAAPSPPYSTWATAATNIQDAVDVANAGDEIAVTNGVYQSGQRVWPAASSGTNRLAITKPLKVYSVNGPDVTIIDGGGTNRCVYVAADATLTGFTLTNGYAPGIYPERTGGGGLYCQSNSSAVFDCVIVGNKIGYPGGPTSATGAGAYGGTLVKCTLALNRANLADGGGAAYAILNNCVLTNNYGEGAFQCTLNDCTLVGNSSGGFTEGGGALQCTLNNCSLVDNFAYYGGGAEGCTLNNCSLKYNWGDDHGGGADRCILNNCYIAGNGGFYTGGGARYSTLNNCIIADNGAYNGPGGGTVFCTLNNCVLINNWAYNSSGYDSGGGASGGTLNNCTLSANQSAHSAGGGAAYATLNNCILYYNTGSVDPNFDTNCILNYCCTTPMPSTGVGNFTNEPVFVDLIGRNLRLQPGSPCINAGNNSYVTNSTDLDGNPRISGGTVDVGAYEFVFARQLFSSKLNGTEYRFSFDTESNRTYVIEYKNALTDPDWHSCPAIIGNGQAFTVTNRISDAAQRFYRLRVE